MIKLRSLTLEDAQITWKWRNLPDVRNDFSGQPFHVSIEHEQQWIKTVIGSNLPNSVFGVELLQSADLVGLTYLKNIHLVHRQAEFAILISPEHSGKGVGKAACRETLKFGFHDLNLHRIYLKVRQDNAPAIRVYKSCGFTEEGILRDDVFKQGEFRNHILMSVLEHEFKG
ncbi:MAG: N-acetyltransferase [Bacteroidetes bacterium]|nr:MAG: N-acetyltransferase [Bacteroidota bacterium]REK07245.1 MAG: N-acetyltransferase [Bacteroidota bacterium]REK31768.1 MAG: N-acetyltransferase [Bacteroidota bacterium]REK48052.1 MAG: N-acetyltransferase [Bacteroidota bacterium]